MSSTATQSEQGIDPALIAPFVRSVRAVFESMVRVPITVQRPHLKRDPAPSHDVSGIIGFSGHSSGSVVVSFQLAAAEKLASAFAGVAIKADTTDFCDAIGELTNMIAGGAKKDLGGRVNISVPSVIIGCNHHVARPSEIPSVVIPCTTPVGDFCVEVNIKKSNHRHETEGNKS